VSPAGECAGSCSLTARSRRAHAGGREKQFLLALGGACAKLKKLGLQFLGALMVTEVQSPTKPQIIYPDSDGKPIANNTVQFGWIVEIQHNLNWMCADDPNVFVAGDLFWYPV
jgi:hypothetical protein